MWLTVLLVAGACAGPLIWLWHRFVLSFADTKRVVLIAVEYFRVFHFMRHVSNAVVIFCSARIKPGDPRYDTLRRIATKLGRCASLKHAMTLTVLSGNGPGGMEASMAGGFEGGTNTVGLGIALPFEPDGYVNPYCQRAATLRKFSPRKVGLVRYADLGVIIGEGGFGTMDEFFEVATLQQCRHDTREVPIYLVHEASAGPIHHMVMEMLRRGVISATDVRRITLVACPNIPVVTVSCVTKRNDKGESLPESQWKHELVSMRRLASEDEMVEEICSRIVSGKAAQRMQAKPAS